MARYLVGTIPARGHVTPGLSIVRELVRRGHQVQWLTHERYRSAVVETGADFVPLGACPWDEADLDPSFPGRAALEGLPRLKFDLKHVFIDSMPAQVRELSAAFDAFRPHVLLGDTAFMGVPTLGELRQFPYATFGITALTLPSKDTAPFGLGLAPAAGALGRVRNAALQWLVDRVVFKDVSAHFNRRRAELNLPPVTEGFFAGGHRGYLHLQATVPGFEYPRSDLAPHVHFIGPFLPTPPPTFDPPSWWGDLAQGRPVVHVTQGTLTTDSSQLLVPALRALADEDVLVVATTGGPPVETVATPLPRNARLERFISYAHFLPRVDVMVTNGGYGGVQMALSHGVPLVVAGNTEEKPEIAARVAWSGAGLNLKTSRPSPRAVRAAVKEVLETPHYRQRAQSLQREMAQLNAPARAAELLERLAASGRPVGRDAFPGS